MMSKPYKVYFTNLVEHYRVNSTRCGCYKLVIFHRKEQKICLINLSYLLNLLSTVGDAAKTQISSRGSMASKFGGVMLLFISIFIFFGFSYNPNTSGVTTGSGPSGFKRYSYYDNSRINHKNVFTISFLEPEYDRFIFPKADKISNRGNMLRTSRIKTFINNHAPNQIV